MYEFVNKIKYIVYCLVKPFLPNKLKLINIRILEYKKKSPKIAILLQILCLSVGLLAGLLAIHGIRLLIAPFYGMMAFIYAAKVEFIQYCVNNSHFILFLSFFFYLGITIIISVITSHLGTRGTFVLSGISIFFF